jgi:hypothetical protein
MCGYLLRLINQSEKSGSERGIHQRGVDRANRWR